MVEEVNTTTPTSPDDVTVNESQQQEAPAPQAEPTVKDLLVSLNGPDQVQIEEWKKQFGEVFVSAFSEAEVYIWRPLKRDEFRQLQEAQADPEQMMTQLDYEEAVCSVCVLWSSANATATGANSKGGTASTLAENIMSNSNFWAPQQAAAYTAQL